MTIVLVHGVPETAQVWDGVRSHLDGDVVVLSLPGFGCARPNGFGATMDEYADWLRGEIDGIDGPVDLVGHDWGGILTTRIATTHPEVRSWVTDAVTVVDPGFEWHDFAKIWQTPGDGEAYWEGMRATPADSAALLSALGVPEDDAVRMIEALDDDMIGCILDLYRSATTIGTEWAASEPVSVPGLVIGGSADPFGDETRSRAVAGKLGVDVKLLDGLGHWWLLQDPAAAAAALKAFWAGL